jgi:signal transduction histidine kinase
VVANATPAVDADRSRLTQVLDNLLSNALKFTPPGGQVQAISKGIVEAHGGSLSACSQEGRGTTFRIELPARRTRGAGPSDAEPIAPACRFSARSARPAPVA